MFPGDPSAPGYLIWNCRCRTVAAVDGWEDMSGQLRSDKAIGGMSYEEWKNAKPVSQPITHQEDVGNAIRDSYIREYMGAGNLDSVDDFDVSVYNEIINQTVQIDAEKVFNDAISGKRHAGVYQNAVTNRQTRLKKSIVSHTDRVLEHRDKIRCGLGKQRGKTARRVADKMEKGHGAQRRTSHYRNPRVEREV